LGIGDWGFGDWGLGPIPNPQSPSPIPNPQSPIPDTYKLTINNKVFNYYFILFTKQSVILFYLNI
jgi:hypothetical protein